MKKPRFVVLVVPHMGKGEPKDWEMIESADTRHEAEEARLQALENHPPANGVRYMIFERNRRQTTTQRNPAQ